MPAVLWVRRALTLARDHKGMASPSDGGRKSHRPCVATTAQLASTSIASQRCDERPERVRRRTGPHYPWPCDSVHYGDLCRDRSAAGHGGHRQDRLRWRSVVNKAASWTNSTIAGRRRTRSTTESRSPLEAIPPRNLASRLILATSERSPGSSSVRACRLAR